MRCARGEGGGRRRRWGVARSSRSWSRLKKQREKYRMSPSTWRDAFARSARTCLPPWVWKVCIAVRSFLFNSVSRTRSRLAYGAVPRATCPSLEERDPVRVASEVSPRRDTGEARRVALAAGRRVTGFGFPVDVTRPGADIVPVVRARGVGVRRRKEACCLNSSGRRHPRWRSPEPPDLRDIFDP